MRKISYIDVFAGASGLSEGFVRAGFTPIAHVEMDESACFTIKTRAVYHYLKEVNDLESYYQYLKGEISRDELYSLVPKKITQSVINVEIGNGTIDGIFNQIKKLSRRKTVELIIGGPPCQAYSLLGRHNKKMDTDPRTLLYLQYGKFLKEFKPKAFVFENVPGLLSSKKGEHFENLRTYFGELGYNVYHQIINSADLGVVQSRKRVIIVGWKRTCDKGFPLLEMQNLGICINDILSDLPSLRPGDSNNIVEYATSNNTYLAQAGIRSSLSFVTQHVCRPHNDNDLKIYKFAIQKWNKGRIRIKYNDLPKEVQTQKNMSSFLDRFKVVDGLGTSHTIVAHIAKDGHYYIHPDIKQCRSISVREAARIQSFPDDFYFEGSRSSAFKQIGNAVPPLMAHAIAVKIKEMLWKK